MRVTRRARPSQVGCGASIGRRRLLHTQASEVPLTAENHEQGSMAGLTMVVRLDFHDAREMPAEPAHSRQVQGDRLQSQEPGATASSARGR